MRTLTRELKNNIGQSVQLEGFVHFRRDLGGVQFLVLRDRSGTVQCVIGKGVHIPMPESSVRVHGKVVENPRAPGGLEVQVSAFEPISAAVEPAPVEVSKEEWKANPETLLDYRYVSLRGLKERAVLRIQAELVQGFRQSLVDEDFTEIFTPKIVSAGAEGGSALFPIQYFEQTAYLAQSPQTYKQIMVGVYERVFETACVYRAEEHATSRHLNEYMSLDLEMGFIESEEDVMNMENLVLAGMFRRVAERCQAELEVCGVTLPAVPERIPRIPLAEARALCIEKYGYTNGGKDLDPEGERIVSRHFLETTGSDFVFVTHYPRAARPFYAYPNEDGTTRSFDLLFRGIEITSGGQRIHDYDMLLENMRYRNVAPTVSARISRCSNTAVPPHGGLAMRRWRSIGSIRWASTTRSP
ncbi:MAG: aspartate--tRNA(Asn) ligase [Pleurocapsa sp. SU_196_0]|nr:aspartate--tRNA(Asn) ligase [Pleurocapsa sp. SU_196_0]